MVYAKTWSGDWHARILERVRQRGFASLTEYTSAHVGVSLLVLAKELGPDDVAAAQLDSMLVEEAIRTHTVPRALRDLFVRELRESLPQGWRSPLDDEARFKVVKAYAGWKVDHQEHLDSAAASAACQGLLNAELPTGWLPEGPDDPVIIAFVDRCLGRAPS